MNSFESFERPQDNKQVSYQAADLVPASIAAAVTMLMTSVIAFA